MSRLTTKKAVRKYIHVVVVFIYINNQTKTQNNIQGKKSKINRYLIFNVQSSTEVISG